MEPWGWIGVWGFVFMIQVSILLLLSFKKIEFGAYAWAIFLSVISALLVIIESAIVHFWIK